jgi:molybdopterin-containing oxidoreductase family iron-sulfur binding subunit
VLSVLLGQPGRSPYELVQETWKERLGEEDFGRAWRRAVHDGVVPESQAPTVEVSLAEGALNQAQQQEQSAAKEDTVDVLFAPDPSVWDGRYANNGWLQELPKPLSKVTWDNCINLSPALAKRLQASNGSVIELRIGDRTIEGPAWIMPGHADGCVTVTLGYGRTRGGRLANGVGYDAYSIRPADSGWLARGVAIRNTGREHKLAATQNHHAVEGRDLVRVTTLARYEDDPQHLKSHDQHGEAGEAAPSFYPEFEYDGNRWGMVIDQTACIGCNACVVACLAENNSPIVGKDQVMVGREMHWLRIDQYYFGEPEDAETYFQPVLCMHCEKAPCEVVCPVGATMHSSEGLNEMIYNRCDGTRNCSNNCPYKVRRFNFLQYTDETTPSLKLMRNPDVTARSRGVMEKCTYCVQRINNARIEAKKENRPVRDGEVVTACQGACPTRAIVFGNMNDTDSRVHELKQSPLNYGLLEELNTQPRTTYLARVVNPHPDLPPPKAAEADQEHHPGTAAEAGRASASGEGAQH